MQWRRRVERGIDVKGCLVQVGNGIELDTVGSQFEPYRWRPWGVTCGTSVPNSRGNKAAANLSL